MPIKFHQQIAGIPLLLGCAVAMAVPFGSFDTRSMGMGGAGVAAANADAAPLFNPALLSAAKAHEDFGLILPTIGVRVADPDKLHDSVTAFQDGNYVNNLQTAINTLNAFVVANNAGAIPAAAAAVGSNLTIVSSQLTTLSNKPITIDGGIATVIAIPSKNFGAAFYANGIVATGGIFNYSDAATLQTLANHATTCAGNAASPSCATLAAFNTNNLTSGINFKGITFGEVGFALSHEYKIFNHDIALGITPKIIKAQLFDIPISVNNTNQTNFSSTDYLAEYSLVNFDLGAAKNYNNGWRTGLVIKNVIPQSLDFKRASTAGAIPVATGEQLTLRPQARIGISHENSWSTVAMDVDLTRNDPAGFEKATRYIALGGELNAFDWAQLRAGYRVDAENSARNVASLGLGISPFGVHADLAVAGNANEIGASFQLGFRF